MAIVKLDSNFRTSAGFDQFGDWLAFDCDTGFGPGGGGGEIGQRVAEVGCETGFGVRVNDDGSATWFAKRERYMAALREATSPKVRILSTLHLFLVAVVEQAVEAELFSERELIGKNSVLFTFLSPSNRHSFLLCLLPTQFSFLSTRHLFHHLRWKAPVRSFQSF